MEKCSNCGGNYPQLFHPHDDPSLPALCSDCQLEFEEAMHEQEELDYLQAEYW